MKMMNESFSCDLLDLIEHIADELRQEWSDKEWDSANSMLFEMKQMNLTELQEKFKEIHHGYKKELTDNEQSIILNSSKPTLKPRKGNACAERAMLSL